MAIERHAITSREQWLELRKSDVTASVIGALFSAHPYLSALKLYMMHSGVEFPTEDESRVMRRGRLMEPVVAQAVQDDHPDWQLEDPRSYFRDPDLRLGATPDRFIIGDPRGLGVLQIKTADPRVFDRFWHNGTKVPFYIELQTAVEMLLTNAAFGYVAVMPVPTFDFIPTILPVPRLANAERKVIDAVNQFWLDVANGREPPANYNLDAELIKFLAPRETAGKDIDLSGDNLLPVLLEERAQVMEKLSDLEARKQAINTEIQFKMRDASSAIVPGWSITWKTVHYKPRNAYDARPLNIRRIKEKVANV